MKMEEKPIILLSSNAINHDQSTISKEKIINLIDQRHKERHLIRENVQEIRMKEAAADENHDYFMNSFNERCRDIEQNILNVQNEENSLDVQNLPHKFNKIANSVQELQNFLSNSTFFLPDYNIKSCQRIITELVFKLDQIKVKLIPKKKFGFKNKAPAPAPPPPVDVSQDLQQKLDKSIAQKVKKAIVWTEQNRQNEIIQLNNVDVNNKDITISTLTNCLVQIEGHPGSLQLSNLTNCLVVCGPVARSVFAEYCTNSTLIFGCQQFRFHSSQNCNVYMHVTCRGIIEDCTDIGIGPYQLSYEAIDIDFIKAALDRNTNNWKDVADFNWLSNDKPSPNWHIIPEQERIVDIKSVVDKFSTELCC